VNAGITGEILHIDGGQSPDTEIATSRFRQGRTSPPFPALSEALRDGSGGCSGSPLLVP
jgi:hypothetical protein